MPADAPGDGAIRQGEPPYRSARAAAAAASSHNPAPRCGALSVIAPILGMCGFLVTLVALSGRIRGNPFETAVRLIVLIWCGLCLVGIVAAAGAFWRRERWRGLRIAGLFVNLLLFISLALWWSWSAPQGEAFRLLVRMHDWPWEEWPYLPILLLLLPPVTAGSITGLVVGVEKWRARKHEDSRAAPGAATAGSRDSGS